VSSFVTRVGFCRFAFGWGGIEDDVWGGIWLRRLKKFVMKVGEGFD
jgi:hypothetical protein